MPELPEVETICRDLRKSVVDTVVREITVRDARVIKGGSASFRRAVLGCAVKDVQRRGKAIILYLAKGFLVVQPMMTGQLIAAPADQTERVVKETRVIFELSKGMRLLYNDQRLFGRLQFVTSLDEMSYFKKIGPEPLDPSFTPEVLAQSLQKRKTPIKPLLLDHKVVAGIGNIYASEVLFVAGISPFRLASDLSRDEVEKLCGAIKTVLRTAIKMRGSTMRNYVDGLGRKGRYLEAAKVYGRAGEPCRVCGRPISTEVQAQRSTFFCAHCQYGEKV